MSRPRRLKVIVEADGGARGNPGPAGYGAVVREAATGEVLLERAEALGVTTNNVAEYSGLIAGLQAAADLGAVEVEARMDSKLVVEQMSGRWQIKHPGLRPLAAQAAALVRRFDTVRFVWVPRDQNKHADALANAAMDGVSPEDLSPPAASEPVAPAPASSSAWSQASRSWAPPSGGAVTRLVLVRHGETELTAQRRYSGRGDVGLSAVGLAQAEALGSRLAQLGVPSAASSVASSSVAEPPVVVTSPLARCVTTAHAIATACGGVPVLTEPDLIECDFGQWEGLTFAEVRERWPGELERWLASPAVAPPGGESFQAVAARTRRAVTRLLAERTGQTVIVVSHVTPIKLVLRDALAAGEAFLHRLYLDPAGISIVDSWRDGGVAVRTINDTAHLATR